MVCILLFSKLPSPILPLALVLFLVYFIAPTLIALSFMIVILIILFAMNVRQLLLSKRFWTLVSAVVAALAAFFLCESCSRSSILFRGSGDIEYIYRGSSGPSFVEVSNSER